MLNSAMLLKKMGSGVVTTQRRPILRLITTTSTWSIMEE